MQGRALDARTAELHGIEYRRRRNAPRASHGQLNRTQDGFLFLGRVLVGNRPARRLCRCSKLRTLCKIIDLDNGAVDVIGQVSAPCTDLRDCVPDLVRRMTDTIIGNNLDPLRTHEVVCLCMRGERMPLCTLHIEYEHRESALARHASVQLTQRPRRAVARVGKRLQSEKFLPFVDLGKCRALHIDLAAHFKIRNRFMQLLDNIADCTRIHRDILALYRSVATRDGTRKRTVFIAECERESVNLFLDNEFRCREMRQNASGKGAYFLLTKYVLQREHGDIMANKYADLALCTAAHLLRRRILRDEFRILRLDRFQPLHEHIKVIVGNIRCIRVIILLGILSDLLPQLCELALDLHNVAHIFLTASKSVHTSV